MRNALFGLVAVVTFLGGSEAMAQGFGTGRGCAMPPRPAQHQTAQGQYQLVNTQRWVPGGWVTVPGQQVCQSRGRRGRVTRCHTTPARQVWQAGRHETVQSWVWVPAVRQQAPIDPWAQQQYRAPAPVAPQYGVNTYEGGVSNGRVYSQVSVTHENVDVGFEARFDLAPL